MDVGPAPVRQLFMPTLGHHFVELQKSEALESTEIVGEIVGLWVSLSTGDS